LLPLTILVHLPLQHVVLTQQLPHVDPDIGIIRRIMIVTFLMRYFHDREAGFDRNNPLHKRVDPTMETRMLEPRVIQQALV
jgi:hypothetical protein